jgi:transcriptional regulator with XRE-family HTH domain
MPSIISSTMRKIWKKMADKEYRDNYVAAHLSNTISAQIFMLREENGWTQKQLADKAHMGQSRISALEDPNYENVEISTLKRLASAFDVALTVRFVPFSELVEWVDGPKLQVCNFANDSLIERADLSPLQFAGTVSMFTPVASAVAGPTIQFQPYSLAGSANVMPVSEHQDAAA